MPNTGQKQRQPRQSSWLSRVGYSPESLIHEENCENPNLMANCLQIMANESNYRTPLALRIVCPGRMQ
jgi:hypothetical protein